MKPEKSSVNSQFYQKMSGFRILSGFSLDLGVNQLPYTHSHAAATIRIIY
jgi:hypothetical protein